MNATSPIFPQVCGKVDGDFVGLFDHVVRGDEPEQPQGPPVAQFPQRNSLPGRYDLKVDFPRDSPKFIVVSLLVLCFSKQTRTMLYAVTEITLFYCNFGIIGIIFLK